jgi:UDP-2-acetamido-3-amino-2,3-dideoxy-glucuronate N-acetyltransferase
MPAVEARAPATWTEGTTPVFTDDRGALTLVPVDAIPFTPNRTYVLHGIPRGATRGGHASRSQQRWLVGVAGNAKVTLDDGVHASTLELAGGDTLLVPAGVWHEIEAVEDGTMILVFADGDYDPADYVRERSKLPLSSAVAAATASA